jgi:hypothetical protein
MMSFSLNPRLAVAWFLLLLLTLLWNIAPVSGQTEGYVPSVDSRPEITQGAASKKLGTLHLSPDDGSSEGGVSRSHDTGGSSADAEGVGDEPPTFRVQGEQSPDRIEDGASWGLDHRSRAMGVPENPSNDGY